MRPFYSLALAGILFSLTSAAADWRPVEPSELAQKQPRIEPAADAEAIFWDVRIEDRVEGGSVSLQLTHYLRIKIFTPHGKEQFATVEIPRTGSRSLKDVAARTVKPDGSIVEVKKEAIFERELVSAKNLKMRGITFALPNLEVGDIIEYRYREIRDDEIADYMRLDFQREIPIWNVAYHLKPLTQVPWGMRSLAFQCEDRAFQKEKDGFYVASMTNMPAFKEEPNMPPEGQLRAWMLIYYEAESKLDAEKYWKDLGKRDFERYKPEMKADDAVKKMAAELAAGASTPEEKVAAIDAFCRSKIRNLGSSAFPMTADQKKAIKENRSPSDTLKQKAGWGNDVNLLFAAMLNSVGIEARMARIPDRGDVFFNAQLPTTYFIKSFSVAVKLGEKWTFRDPSTPYLDKGMLRWEEEGQKALVSDPEGGVWAPTQYSEPALSKRERKATLALKPDGSLEGTVEYTYTGHAARAQKLRFEDMTPADREKDWKESLQARMSSAEISDFAMSEIADPAKPLVVKHKVLIPNYATRTGKRLLLQPSFFQINASPRFPESARKWDIYFNYGWAEHDEVSIELPEGWTPDPLDIPGAMSLGTTGQYSVEVNKSPDGRRLVYRRSLDIGRGSPLLLRVSGYSQIKKVFDSIQDKDAVTASLRSAQ